MPHMLPFSLPLSLQGCWGCSVVALLPAGIRKDVAGVQRASCAIPGLHKGKMEGQRELDSSSGREVAAGTAEELQKFFALFPAK